MNFSLIINLVIAVAGFGSAWQIQTWRMDAREKEYVEQALADQQLSAKAALRRQEKVIEAVNDSAVREIALRRESAGARTALVSLSHAAEQALRDAATSHDACINRASAFNDVLQQSTERYRSLGETCDRHASDVKTLIEAWPR